MMHTTPGSPLLRIIGCALVLAASLLATPVARAEAAGALAPLPAGSAPASSHAPYAAGECAVCHTSADVSKPGAVPKPAPALCLDCHDEFARTLAKPHVHRPARKDCTLCHNPHNSPQAKLLLSELYALCTDCHSGIDETNSRAAVKHAALTKGRKCSNCHDPHSSAVARLLVRLPFDLCVSCHGQDGLTDAKGKKLQNIKAWLDANKEWHGPVATKDCSACHQAHGSENFRLLETPYPPEFYAPYDARNYALCFSCHKEAAFSTAQTTTLTNFRDGARNLHFVHLQEIGRGRTCRACHEVHASTQAHQIREGVPYGSSGWVLKLNYTKTATGGSCDKTCHTKKVYANRSSP